MRTKPSPQAPKASPGTTATRWERMSRSQDEPLAELHGGKARALHRGEHVEGALGLKAFQAHIVQAVHNQAAAHIVLAPHVFNVVVAVFHGLNGGVLAHGGGAHNGELVQLRHQGDNLFGARGVAHAGPAA